MSSSGESPSLVLDRLADRATRELIALGRHVQRGTPHPDLTQLW
jgi:hypothetical protein